MEKKERALPSYYKFNIDNTKGVLRFTDTDGNDLPDYKSKLTKSQWKKASKFLERDLIPFSGYVYKIKEEFKHKNIIKIT